MEKMGVLKTMSEFENVFEDLGVQTANMDEALDSVYGSGIPQTEVTDLIEKIQVEAGIEAGEGLGDADKKKVPSGSAVKDNEIDSLESRLQNLKQF